MKTADRASSIPTPRKVLCLAYGAIALAALIATWSQGGPYLHSASDFLGSFWQDTKANSASRFVAAEALWLSASVAILTLLEGRKHQMKWVWLYIGGFFVAVSVAFPLFLIARELHMRDEPPRLRSVDTLLLALMAAGVAGLTAWIDIGQN
ncbi:hypothetical protein A5645_18480 [Mycobacterium asiaticum]|uniref:DUF2834 domain-containing protein n=1 Tax=Mycobacterium asiaticum TaxID=1790 RepID=UPI0007EFA3A0|nr:DUF2834 domain-containing protein [Mycobacterium asiaticum]OBK93828.1 hypothetical protein A5645_18480 [Mycobacterium asiaticum]